MYTQPLNSTENDDFDGSIVDNTDEAIKTIIKIYEFIDCGFTLYEGVVANTLETLIYLNNELKSCNKIDDLKSRDK